MPEAVAAVNLLGSRPAIDPNRIFVLGHSQGGNFAPLIAKTDPRIAGVILAAALPSRSVRLWSDNWPTSLPCLARSELMPVPNSLRRARPKLRLTAQLSRSSPNRLPGRE